MLCLQPPPSTASMENDSFWVLELENALVLTQLSDRADFGVAFDQAGPVHADWVVTAGAVHCALAGKGLQLRERGAGYQVLVGLMLKRGHKINSKTFTVPTYPQSQAFPTTQFWSFAQWTGRSGTVCLCMHNVCVSDINVYLTLASCPAGKIGGKNPSGNTVHFSRYWLVLHGM